MGYDSATKRCIKCKKNQNWDPILKKCTKKSPHNNDAKKPVEAESTKATENNTYQNEVQDRFLAEWITCNENTPECKEQYPYLKNEYWDEQYKIRVPKKIKDIIDKFKKACNDENGKIEITYGNTAPYTAPYPWQRATDGTVFCYTTKQSTRLANVPIKDNIGEIMYTSEQEAYNIGVDIPGGYTGYYTIFFKPLLTPFIIEGLH